MAIPYLDTLIANNNSRFTGEAVEVVVSASVFNPALLPDDETLLRAYGNSKLSTLGNVYGEKAEGTSEGVTYSSLTKNCYENDKFFRELFSKRTSCDRKKNQPSIFARHT